MFSTRIAAQRAILTAPELGAWLWIRPTLHGELLVEAMCLIPPLKPEKWIRVCRVIGKDENQITAQQITQIEENIIFSIESHRSWVLS